MSPNSLMVVFVDLLGSRMGPLLIDTSFHGAAFEATGVLGLGWEGLRFRLRRLEEISHHVIPRLLKLNPPVPI